MGKQVFQDLLPATVSACCSGYVGLCLQVQEQLSLILQKAVTLRDESVKKIFIEVVESNILTAKNAGYERCNIRFLDSVKLGTLNQPNFKSVEERLMGGVNLLSVIEQRFQSRIGLSRIGAWRCCNRDDFAVGRFCEGVQYLCSLIIQSSIKVPFHGRGRLTRLSRIGRLWVLRCRPAPNCEKLSVSTMFTVSLP